LGPSLTSKHLDSTQYAGHGGYQNKSSILSG
jgi:hypothetical protein